MGRGAPIVALSLLLLCSGCIGGTTPPSPREKALQALIQSDFLSASEQLETLLKEDPENEELHLALGIAYFGQFSNRLDWIITLALSFSQDLQALAYSEFNPQGAVTNENDYLLSLIEHALLLFLGPLERAVFHLNQVTSPSTTLKLDGFYLYFLTDAFMDLSGEFRRADTAFLGGLSSLLLAPLEFLYAHDLRFDAHLLVHKVLAGGAVTSPAKLSNVAVSLLSAPEYPSFLELRQEDRNENGKHDGVERLENLKSTLTVSFGRFAQISTCVSERPGIISIKEREEGPSLLLKNRVRMDEEGSFSFEASRGTFQTLEIALSEKTIPAFARMSAHLKEGNPERLSLYDDFLPALLPWVLAILSHIQSPTIKAILQLFGGSPDGVLAVLRDFLPDRVFLNPSAYFASPRGVRAWLPIYRTDLDPDENNFLFEWECPEFSPSNPTSPIGSTSSFPGGSLLCPKDSPLTDRSHFDAPEFSGKVPRIEPDGIPSPFPYIPFPDPTFSGILYLADPTSGTPEPASLQPLNAYLATVAVKVIPLLNRFQ
jgi:hypothetical protein